MIFYCEWSSWDYGKCAVRGCYQIYLGRRIPNHPLKPSEGQKDHIDFQVEISQTWLNKIPFYSGLYMALYIPKGET